jgi:GNAT superfamily N-acetyltransferase
VTIRPAQSQDRDLVAECWLEFLNEQTTLDERFRLSADALSRWTNDFPFWLSDSTRTLLVAEEDGEIQGFVTAHEWSPPPIYEDSFEVYVNEIYVRPEYRGRGFGRSLLDEVAKWAGSRGARRLRLSMLAANEGARAFWKSRQASDFSVTLTIDLEQPETAQPAAKRGKIGF